MNLVSSPNSVIVSRMMFCFMDYWKSCKNVCGRSAWKYSFLWTNLSKNQYEYAWSRCLCSLSFLFAIRFAAGFPYIKSPIIGCPIDAVWALIWCILHVLIPIRTSVIGQSSWWFHHCSGIRVLSAFFPSAWSIKLFPFLNLGSYHSRSGAVMVVASWRCHVTTQKYSFLTFLSLICCVRNCNAS